MKKLSWMLWLLVLLLVACDSIDPIPAWTPDIVALETADASSQPTITPYVALADTPAPTPLPPVTATLPPTTAPAGTAMPTVAPPANALPPASVADWPQEVARLVNDLRARNGLSPLTYHAVLAQAAQQHANECSQRGTCSNLGADGSDVAARLARLGYTAARSDQAWALSAASTDAVSWWEGDDWPRRLMLTADYTEMGVGVAPASWGYYFVVVYGRP